MSEGDVSTPFVDGLVFSASLTSAGHKERGKTGSLLKRRKSTYAHMVDELGTSKPLNGKTTRVGLRYDTIEPFASIHRVDSWELDTQGELQ